MEMMSHILESCTISQFGDLIRRHSAYDDTVTYDCSAVKALAK